MYICICRVAPTNKNIIEIPYLIRQQEKEKIKLHLYISNVFD